MVYSILYNQINCCDLNIILHTNIQSTQTLQTSRGFVPKPDERWELFSLRFLNVVTNNTFTNKIEN